MTKRTALWSVLRTSQRALKAKSQKIFICIAQKTHTDIYKELIGSNSTEMLHRNTALTFSVTPQCLPLLCSLQNILYDYHSSVPTEPQGKFKVEL